MGKRQMEQVNDPFALSEQYGNKPSFSALVKERFLDEVLAAITSYAEDNGITVTPASLQRVIVTQCDPGDDLLYFDVLYACLLSGSQVTLIASCYFDLSAGFQELHVESVVPIWDGYKPKPALPDDLIPIITKNALDLAASSIVRSLYPRALDHAIPIRVNCIVQKLGLTVVDIPFDPDQSIFGKIFFEDAYTVAEDPETGIMSIIPVTAGTIFVNKLPGEIADERIRNNTIIHECVHWLFHRPAFLLAKAWKQDESAIACRRTTSQAAHREWSSIDRMEWQANSLAPRVLMQAWATRYIADNLILRYSGLSPLLGMEKTIDDLSHHFNVSRQLAKIRMEELGYEHAKTAFSYYDRKTYTIPFENAAREIARNKAFRNALATGAYEYADQCFVLRDRRYLWRDNDGILHLTPYAKRHPDLCCLSFVSRRGNREMQSGMLRDGLEDEVFVPGSSVSAEQINKTIKRIYEIRNALPLSFGETLVAHMQRKGFTVEQLSEASLVSLKQIQRYRNQLNPVVPMNKAVALCIGLKLHPILAEDLIHKAGLTFNSSYAHTAYYSLLLCMTNSSIYECNAMLKSMGIPCFGKEE